MDYKEKLRDAVDWYRVNRSKISKTELAKRSGLSRGFVSDFISGIRGASDESIEKLAKGLGIDVKLLRPEYVDKRFTPRQTQWINLLLEAEALGLEDYIKGQMDSLRIAISEKRKEPTSEDKEAHSGSPGSSV